MFGQATTWLQILMLVLMPPEFWPSLASHMCFPSAFLPADGRGIDRMSGWCRIFFWAAAPPKNHHNPIQHGLQFFRLHNQNAKESSVDVCLIIVGCIIVGTHI
jgi:hypothetical protein